MQSSSPINTELDDNTESDDNCQVTRGMWEIACECSKEFNKGFWSMMCRCCPCLCLSSVCTGGAVHTGLGLIWACGTFTPLK